MDTAYPGSALLYIRPTSTSKVQYLASPQRFKAGDPGQHTYSPVVSPYDFSNGSISPQCQGQFILMKAAQRSLKPIKIDYLGINEQGTNVYLINSALVQSHQTPTSCVNNLCFRRLLTLVGV